MPDTNPEPPTTDEEDPSYVPRQMGSSTSESDSALDAPGQVPSILAHVAASIEGWGGGGTAGSSAEESSPPGHAAEGNAREEGGGGGGGGGGSESEGVDEEEGTPVYRLRSRRGAIVAMLRTLAGDSALGPRGRGSHIFPPLEDRPVPFLTGGLAATIRGATAVAPPPSAAVPPTLLGPPPPPLIVINQPFRELRLEERHVRRHGSARQTRDEDEHRRRGCVHRLRPPPWPEGAPCDAAHADDTQAFGYEHTRAGGRKRRRELSRCGSVVSDCGASSARVAIKVPPSLRSTGRASTGEKALNTAVGARVATGATASYRIEEGQARDLAPLSPPISALLRARESLHFGGRGGWTKAERAHIAAATVPPVHARREVERRSAKAYIGRFSACGDLFVAAFQDAHIRVFNCDAAGDLSLRKDVHARRIRWTVTDAVLSPDSRQLLYSTIDRYVHVVTLAGTEGVVRSVANITEVHHELDFLARLRGPEHCGIWSLSWAPGAAVVAAGTTLPGVLLYDLAAERACAAVTCHADDVNAVAFLDAGGDVLVSGSDDTRLFVHDRRTMAERRRPVGALLGHTEGVTHIDARGDGRYLISNAKDSTIRVWDMRKMSSDAAAFRDSTRYAHSMSQFDYRWETYPHRGRDVRRHVDDSLVAIRGHSVLNTLIRAYWSPLAATGGRYIYSGSACGSVFIFDAITGHIAHELAHHSGVVRDASWHPGGAQLVSVSWDGSICQWGQRPMPGGRLPSAPAEAPDWW